MKRIVSPILVAVLMFAMSFMAVAKGKNEKVTFSRDIVVNGTVVKKGTYKVKFDDQNKELLIMDGKAMVAKTTARLENRNRKPSSTEVIFTEKDNQNLLNSITFIGETDTIVIGEGAKETAAPSN
jgi:hypothetical protein